jgi:hypothetical protein
LRLWYEGIGTIEDILERASGGCNRKGVRGRYEKIAVRVFAASARAV